MNWSGVRVPPNPFPKCHTVLLFPLDLLYTIFSQTNIMSLDLNQVVPSVVRSVAVAVVALPLALSVSGTLNAGSSFLRAQSEVSSSENTTTLTQNDVKGELTRACLDYLLSKEDSKAERSAKDQIDEFFGNEMNYGEVCKWVYR